MTPLHHFGEALRSLLIAVPLPLVRAAFLAILIGLFVWVGCLPASAVTNTDDTSARRVNLRPWALLSLAIQIAIYSFL
jgi:hypothetical protein